MRLLFTWLINAAALFALPFLMSSVNVTNVGAALIAALVLGAAASGPPGKLVTHFTGADAGTLSVPVMIVPGSLDVAAIDRLS